MRKKLASDGGRSGSRYAAPTVAVRHGALEGAASFAGCAASCRGFWRKEKLGHFPHSPPTHFEKIEMAFQEVPFLMSSVQDRLRDSLTIAETYGDVGSNNSPTHHELFDYLLDFGALELAWAAQPGFENAFEKLLALGVSINQVDTDGKTALHHVLLQEPSPRRDRTQEDHFIAVGFAARRLLEAGADGHSVLPDGRSALDLAVCRGWLRIARQIQTGVDDKSDLEGSRTIVARFKVLGGNMESPTGGWLPQREGEKFSEDAARKHNSVTLLLDAARSGDVGMFEALREAGANLWVRGERNENALHFACGAKCPPLVERLLSLGFDPNERSIRFFTPLHFALWTNLTDDPTQDQVQQRRATICLLLVAGARLDESALLAAADDLLLLEEMLSHVPEEEVSPRVVSQIVLQVASSDSADDFFHQSDDVLKQLRLRLITHFLERGASANHSLAQAFRQDQERNDLELMALLRAHGVQPEKEFSADEPDLLAL